MSCEQCGETFQAKRSDARFCSPKCHYVWYQPRRPPSPENPKRCTVEGCDRPHAGKGYCARHYQLWHKYGVPEKRGRKHLWTDEITYDSAHYRTRRERGKASDYACVDCGKPARHWSYKFSGVGERWEYGRPYSTEPMEYDPRCQACHHIFDVQHGKERTLSPTCRRGHLLTPENTYVRPSGYRQCRTCAAIGRARRRGEVTGG